MQMNPPHLWLLVTLAVIHGVTMKLADLHNEHGAAWFPGAAHVFGMLWGLTGSLLIVLDRDVAIALFAMVIAFLIRMRLDFRNHATAAALMFVAFAAKGQMDVVSFLFFFAFFGIFGSIKDHLDDVLHRRDWVQKSFEFMWYYFASTALYSALTGRWNVFIIFSAYVLSYNFTKHLLQADS